MGKATWEGAKSPTNHLHTNYFCLTISTTTSYQPTRKIDGKRTSLVSKKSEETGELGLAKECTPQSPRVAPQTRITQALSSKFQMILFHGCCWIYIKKKLIRAMRITKTPIKIPSLYVLAPIYKPIANVIFSNLIRIQYTFL